jgi:4-amino-4-deoxy-L-arabinose transferase-like glycosyltransferase
MPSSSRPRRLGEPLLIALALLLYWVMAASVSPRMGVTADEVVHLTGGYSYWKFNDYRLHPENGTLPMRLAALPLLGMDLKFPPLDHPLWLNSKVNLVGEIFFYQLGNPLAEMLQRGRAAIALLGILTCWLTWRWARGLFGRAAGWLALILAVFCPALLAHGGLITSDMAFTACALASLSAVWLLLHRATWWRLLGATVACGACFLSKMSGSIIVPLIAVLLLIRWLRPAPYVLAFGRVRWLRRRSRLILATLGLLLVTGAGSLVIVWANYSFRYEGPDRTRSAFTDYYFRWDVLLEKERIPWSDKSSLAGFAPQIRQLTPGPLVKLVGSLREHRLLPEAYLWGFAHTYKFSRERPAYFMGEYRKTGWPLFFPVAFLMKTTLPALLLFVSGVAAVVWAARRPRISAPAPARAWLRFRRSTVYRAAPLILFFIVYWIMAVKMTLNLGHRHILPVYPAFYVFAAATTLWLASRAARMVAVLLVLAVALHAFDSLSARPFYLAYFQPLIGGPERAYHYFVESSLDWGQGLPDLKTWLADKKRRGDQLPVFLTYFGADSPRYRGLEVTRFGDEMNDSGVRYFPAQVHGGWFVISATYFHCTFLPMRGIWAEPQETLYWQLVQRIGRLSARQSSLTAEEQTQFSHDAMDVETLQFARLCHYLHNREPQQLIGSSLMLFKLTDEEVKQALYGPAALDTPRRLP